jgi:transcription elongation GreA/GreB family factor
MSRAFVRENDSQADLGGLGRPMSAHTNYVTPRGLMQLRTHLRRATEGLSELLGKDDLASQQRRQELQRDAAYYAERLKRSVLVSPEAQTPDTVRFGVTVDIEDAHGETLSIVIVGEGEANVVEGRVSWVSPLARALRHWKFSPYAIPEFTDGRFSISDSSQQASE